MTTLTLKRPTRAFLPDENGEGRDPRNAYITLAPGEYRVARKCDRDTVILDDCGVNWIIGRRAA